MEVKEKLTIEEKYQQYGGRLFSLRLSISDKLESKTPLVICGYVKKTKLLIGRVVRSSGMTGQFEIPTAIDIIPNHIEGSRYVYVNLGCIEKYPEVKKAVRKKDLFDDLGELEDILF